MSYWVDVYILSAFENNIFFREVLYHLLVCCTC